IIGTSASPRLTTRCAGETRNGPKRNRGTCDEVSAASLTMLHQRGARLFAEGTERRRHLHECAESLRGLFECACLFASERAVRHGVDGDSSTRDASPPDAREASIHGEEVRVRIASFENGRRVSGRVRDWAAVLVRDEVLVVVGK